MKPSKKAQLAALQDELSALKKKVDEPDSGQKEDYVDSLRKTRLILERARLLTSRPKRPPRA
jgi:hypothetical protein